MEKPSYELPMCRCGKHKRYRKTWRKDGVTPIFHSKCDHCKGRAQKRNQRRKKSMYNYERKTYCEKCGFVAEHHCQLDVDHIDGNHKNNDNSNLQTLCANCHRLKTFLNKDWESAEEEGEFR